MKLNAHAVSIPSLFLPIVLAFKVLHSAAEPVLHSQEALIARIQQVVATNTVQSTCRNGF
jgi:hypothetical protein